MVDCLYMDSPQNIVLYINSFQEMFESTITHQLVSGVYPYTVYVGIFYRKDLSLIATHFCLDM
jgi:hypothetical protein